MRLEHLRIHAFGPFAETVEVDVEELAAAGLFLLTGPTGAGKSSLLDAVCFALYGEVPGDRHDAKHLRSDHAAPDAVPEVELRLSVRGRTFTLRRSPAWDRPKRRGAGTTREHARVAVEELVDGQWHTLTTRLDEAGHLITDLLGMTATQFTQVAMLPQGHFQAFLRATSAERHAVLQRLFRTDRFERIEQWLAERRRELRRRSDLHRDAIAVLLHRFSEAAGVPVPDAFETSALIDRESIAQLSTWIVDENAHAKRRATDSASSAAAARVAHEERAREYERAAALQRARHRGSLATERLRALDESAEAAAADTAALELHRRALPVAVALGQEEEATKQRAGIERELHPIAAGLGLSDASLDEIEQALTTAMREQASAESALVLETRLETAVAALEEARLREAETAAALAALTSDVATMPALIARLEGRRETAITAVARIDGLRAEVTRSRGGHEAAVQVVALTQEVRLAQADLRTRIDEAQRLHEHYLDAREARINAMAGELAGQLASGCSCPVCGSTAHPAPALVSVSAGRSGEDAARRAYEDAEATRLATAESLVGVVARLDAASAVAHDDPPEIWAAQWEQARSALADAEKVAATLEAVDLEIQAARDRLGVAEARAASARDAATAATTGALAAGAMVDELAADVGRATGEHSSLSERFAVATRTVAALTRMRTGLERAERARHHETLLHAEAIEAASAAGFDDPAAAGLALLSPVEVERIQNDVRQRDEARRSALAVLSEPEVAEALAASVPELDDLERAVELALAQRDQTESTRLATERTQERLTTLRAKLEGAVAEWTPVLDAWRVAADVSTLAEGTSPDNPLKVRLSAYVLTERLRQVVEAANERLARMTDRRYSLEHTDERVVGAQRGGLSLRVRDDWTGVRRDPATLSGGETFLVSLALALGLADTVTHEAGGTQIDTLFIDEGFGSLDSDTLDDVMDTLDGLREGGRVIGVVSHVAEMRERIPAGLDVVKGRRGSSVLTR